MVDEAAKRRRNLYIIIFLILAIVIFLGGYVLLSNKKVNNKEELPNEDISNIPNYLDVSKLKLVKVGFSEFYEFDIFDVYYGNKKILSSDNQEIIGIDNIKLFADGMIFNILYNDNTGGNGFVILNSNLEVTGHYDGKYYHVKNLSGNVYRGEYKVEENKIFLYSDDMGQDNALACSKKDKPVEYIDVIAYSNGNYSKAKLYSSINGIDYIKENRVICR